jgi:molecular chaperone DnaK (HSP70)
VDCAVYEGERPCVDQNRPLGEFEISGIERAKKGEPQVEVTFALDTNGVLKVTARDKKTKAEATCTITGACKGLDPAEIKRMQKEAEEMEEQDADYKVKLDLKSEIEELAYDTADEDAVLEWLDSLDLGATSRKTLEQKIRELKK